MSKNLPTARYPGYKRRRLTLLPPLDHFIFFTQQTVLEVSESPQDLQNCGYIRNP